MGTSCVKLVAAVLLMVLLSFGIVGRVGVAYADETPTDTPVATDTVVPTDTPAGSTDTPLPTDTPSSSDTPGPSNTPAPTSVPTNTPVPTPTAIQCGSLVRPCYTVLSLPLLDVSAGGAMIGTLILFGLLFPLIRQTSRIVLALGLVFSFLMFVLSVQYGWLFGFALFCLVVVPLSLIYEIYDNSTGLGGPGPGGGSGGVRG